jgi:plastocyanin
MRLSVLMGSTLAVVCAVALWSCGGGGGSTAATTPSSPTVPATTTATTDAVSIVGISGNTAFSPDVVTASVGDMIVFKNNTTVLHHIVLGDGTVIGDIQPGASGSAVVKTASGNFYCTIHSTMIGSLNAAAPPPPPPCTTPGYGC